MDIHPCLFLNLLSKAKRTDGIHPVIYYFCVYLLVLMWMEEPSYFQSTGEPNYDPVKTVLTAARQWMQAARATAKES